MANGPFDSREQNEAFVRAMNEAMKLLPKDSVFVMVVARTDVAGRVAILAKPNVRIGNVLELGLETWRNETPTEIVAPSCGNPNCPRCKVGIH